MVNKLIVSLVFVVIIVSAFTINAFATAVTVPFDENLGNPISELYYPKSKAFIGFEYYDDTFTSGVNQRYYTSVPIVSPTPYNNLSNFGESSISLYKLGSLTTQNFIRVDSHIDEFSFDTISGEWEGDFMAGGVTHQSYSLNPQIYSSVESSEFEYSIYIPEMLAWHEGYASEFGMPGNSLNITIDNGVTGLYLSPYFESGYCSVRVYGTDHTIRCRINPEAFFHYDSDTSRYTFDLNITWDMINGETYKDVQIIQVYDDEYDYTLLNYFISYYSDTDIQIGPKTIFEFSNIEFYFVTNINYFSVYVDTCDRTDLEQNIVIVNPPQNTEPPVQRYTNFVVNAVYGFFTLEILPGFTMGGIFLVMLAFSLVMWFLKVFAGG